MDLIPLIPHIIPSDADKASGERMPWTKSKVECNIVRSFFWDVFGTDIMGLLGIHWVDCSL